MPNTIIKLIVNTTLLQQSSQEVGATFSFNAQTDDWAQIRQEGDGLGSQPGSNSDPADYQSTIYAGDTLTFKGQLDGAVRVPSGSPTPVINITKIDWSHAINQANSNPETIIFETPTVEIPEDGGSILKFTVKNPFPASITSFQAYTIHFVVSYEVAFLDPKIKVIARPNA